MQKRYLCRSVEDHFHKTLVTERHFSFFTLINPPEAFRIMFHCHTGHQKPVKTDPPGRVFSRYRRWGESFLDFPDHLGRKGEAKAHKGGVKFGAVDEAGRIAVEAIEDSVPVLDISVKTFEFLEIDTPASISVKDVHQHFDAILSRIHGSILCQQLLKIKSTKVPTSRAIEGSKHISQFGIISRTRHRRRTRHSLDMLLRTPLALLGLLALSTMR